MKKREILGLLFIFATLFFIANVISLELTISKDTYYPQETLQAQILGNFVSLSADNINIYKENVPRPIPVKSDITKKNDIYYFYAVLPNNIGNYSLVIENTQYLTGGELKNESIIRNFTIERSNNTNVLTINPGFIVTDKDFEIKIKSPFANQQVLLVLEGTNKSKTVSLVEDSEKAVSFSIAGINSSMTSLIINQYSIPVFIINSVPTPDEEDISFYPSELKATITPDSDFFFNVSVRNIGNKNLTNIKLSSNINARFDPETIEKLDVREHKYVNILINIPDSKNKNVSGEINFAYNDKSITMPVYFDITKNSSQVNLTGTTSTPPQGCAQKSGRICVYPETCSGTSTESLDGPCCIGECVVKKSGGTINWGVGAILLIVIVALVGYFVYRMRKSKQKTAKEVLKEKEEDFDERMNPKEVRGKLDKF